MFRVPDAFKVSFKFKSILPTNFNTYMMSLFEPSIENEKIENGAHHYHNTVYADTVSAVTNAIKK